MKAGKDYADAKAVLDELIQRYPVLDVCRDSIMQAYDAMIVSYRASGKLLLAGNGGSAADSDHISGELTKSFYFSRRIDDDLQRNLVSMFGDEGSALADSLEGGLPAIPLPVFNASNTAFSNDVNAAASFAQLVNSLGQKGDVFLGITTSGNSKNIILAMMVAKAKGLVSVALTGKTGGKCRQYADICICVPEAETFKIQELHLPVYHALCLMIETTMFEPKE